MAKKAQRKPVPQARPARPTAKAPEIKAPQGGRGKPPAAARARDPVDGPRFNPEDAWPPRGAGVDPMTTRAALEVTRQGVERQREHADVSRENAKAFIAELLEGMHTEIELAGRFEPGPDNADFANTEYDIDDGWYVDRSWAVEFKDHKLVKALGPGQPDRPARFVAV